MSQAVILFICACISSCVSTAVRLEFGEGDICKQTGNTIWTCKSLKDCPNAQENLVKNGERPDMCTFTTTEPIVCCQPQVNVSSSVGAKSSQMCKRYAESVYVTVPDPSTGDYNMKIDTCPIHLEAMITINTFPREFPHMALIGYEGENGTEWLCGGSLISDRFVLTAAHCSYIKKNRVPSRVRLGDYNIKSKNDDENYESKELEYKIMERIHHPQFTNSSAYNDIALFKLATAVEFNEFIRPICLQTDHQFSKTYGTAVGWGLNNLYGHGVMNQRNMTVISRMQCDNAFKTGEGGKLRDGIQDVSMICATDFYSDSDNSLVDSGGPLLHLLKDPYCMYSQLGVFSFGGQGHKPGVYTRVSNFVPWIESIVWP